MEVLLALIAFGVVGLLIRSFFPSYLGKKGENLATKEDISDITDKVESVKSFYANRVQALEHQNALILEDLRSRHQLRMAAIEKRLQAHQDAYTLWRKLISKVFSNDVMSTIQECQEFWERNCLYLSPDARAAFRDAYFAAADHRNLVHAGIPGNEVRENYKRIREAGEAIVSGVELPTLGEREAEDVTAEKTQS